MIPRFTSQSPRAAVPTRRAGPCGPRAGWASVPASPSAGALPGTTALSLNIFANLVFLSLPLSLLSFRTGGLKIQPRVKKHGLCGARGVGARNQRPQAHRLPPPSLHRPQRNHTRPPARTSCTLPHRRGHLVQELLHYSRQRDRRQRRQGSGHGTGRRGLLKARDAHTDLRKFPAPNRGRGEAR